MTLDEDDLAMITVALEVFKDNSNNKYEYVALKCDDLLRRILQHIKDKEERRCLTTPKICR